MDSNLEVKLEQIMTRKFNFTLQDFQVEQGLSTTFREISHMEMQGLIGNLMKQLIYQSELTFTKRKHIGID